MNVNQNRHVRCPGCNVELKFTRLDAHMRRIHGRAATLDELKKIEAFLKPRTTPVTVTASQIRRATAIRRNERLAQAKLAALLAKRPHKSVGSRQNAQIPASRDDSKSDQQKIPGNFSRTSRVLKGERFCLCGNPAMIGESSCYECIGD